MKKIGVIEIYSKRYGGVVYTQKVKKALSRDFDLEEVNLEAKFFRKRRYLKFFESFYYLFKLKGEKDFWIRDFYSTVTLNKKKTKGKNLTLIFHVDSLSLPLLARIPAFLLEKLFFYRQLRRVDAIVTISEYWKNHFLDRGYKNVYKMNCGYDLNDFNISEERVLEFKKKYQLEGKPIIYLGNCQKMKGVVESYEALKDLDAYLVTSSKRQVNIPALNFDLSYADYLSLLKASTVAITMDKFNTGWNMTAQEAMLLKTPVIGSGAGGTKELYEEAGQIICDFKELKEKVEYLLGHPEARKKMGEAGYNYSKQFTLERFQSEWIKLVKKITDAI